MQRTGFNVPDLMASIDAMKSLTKRILGDLEHEVPTLSPVEVESLQQCSKFCSNLVEDREHLLRYISSDDDTGKLWERGREILHSKDKKGDRKELSRALLDFQERLKTMWKAKDIEALVVKAGRQMDLLLDMRGAFTR